MWVRWLWCRVKEKRAHGDASSSLFFGCRRLSSHAAARGDEVAGGEEDEAAVSVFGTEDHALAFDALEFAWREVGDEAYLSANELFGLGVVECDAADDGAGLGGAVVELELEEFVGLGHLGALEDSGDADVEAREVVDGNVVLDGGGLPGVEGILLLGGLEFVDLRLDGLVGDLLEEQLGGAYLVPFGEEVGAAGVLPAHGAEVHDAVHLVGGEGQEGGAEDGQVGAYLEREVHDRGGALGVGLDEFPGLGVGEVLVAEACEVHHLGQRLAEAVGLDGAAYALGEGGQFADDFVIESGVRSPESGDGGHAALVELVGEDEGAVDEVAEDGDEFGVVLELEVLPGEVVVLGFGGVGAEGVAEDVLLAGELLQVLVEPYGPVAGGGDFVALEVEEFVGGHVGGQDVGAVGMEHGGEDDAVEDDVVLADEVDEFAVGALPPFLPVVAEEFAGEGDVADGCVEPDVEHLAVGAFDRHADTPVEVARNGSGLEAGVNPGLALAVDVGLPVALVAVENPLSEPGFVLVERKEPVLGVLEDGFGAAEGGLGVDEVGGVEAGAAGFALVAIGVLVAAAGAGAGDVAVGQELASLLVVVLLRHFLDEFALVVELLEVGGCGLVVEGAGGAAVDVEGDAQFGEGLLDDFVVAVDDVLRCYAFAAGLDSDGHAVFVAAADKHHLLALGAQVACVDVSRNVHTGQVTDVYGSVGVGQRRGDGIALVLSVFLGIYHWILFYISETCNLSIAGGGDSGIPLAVVLVAEGNGLALAGGDGAGGSGGELGGQHGKQHGGQLEVVAHGTILRRAGNVVTRQNDGNHFGAEFAHEALQGVVVLVVGEVDGIAHIEGERDAGDAHHLHGAADYIGIRGKLLAKQVSGDRKHIADRQVDSNAGITGHTAHIAVIPYQIELNHILVASLGGEGTVVLHVAVQESTDQFLHHGVEHFLADGHLEIADLVVAVVDVECGVHLAHRYRGQQSVGISVFQREAVIVGYLCQLIVGVVFEGGGAIDAVRTVVVDADEFVVCPIPLVAIVIAIFHGGNLHLGVVDTAAGGSVSIIGVAGGETHHGYGGERQK